MLMMLWLLLLLFRQQSTSTKINVSAPLTSLLKYRLHQSPSSLFVGYLASTLVTGADRRRQERKSGSETAKVKNKIVSPHSQKKIINNTEAQKKKCKN